MKWRGYTIRIAIALAAMILSFVVVSALEFVQGTGLVGVGPIDLRNGRLVGVVSLLAGTTLMVTAALVLPARPLRVLFAALLAGMSYPAFVLCRIGLTMSGTPDAIGIAGGVFVVLVLTAAIVGLSWSARSWLSLVFAAVPLAIGASLYGLGSTLASTDDVVYPERLDSGYSTAHALVVLVQIGLPTVLGVIAGWALSASKAAQKLARDQARSSELADLDSAHRTHAETQSGNAPDILAILTVVSAFVLPVSAPAIGWFAHQRLRSSGRSGWGLTTAGIVVGSSLAVLQIVAALTVVAIVLGPSNGSYGSS